MAVELYGPREIAALRRAGEAAAATLAFIGDRLRPGVTTADIDAWVREHTTQLGGTPSQLGYQGFPASVCTSRNHVVCHGIPRADEVLRPGDIINIDVTTGLDGFHGDTSATLVIGDASDEALHVVDAARRCRDAGIATIRDGARQDGWTVVTADGHLSAQFEHTVLVTREGVEILTSAPYEKTST